jgi:hypothetical protein
MVIATPPRASGAAGRKGVAATYLVAEAQRVTCRTRQEALDASVIVDSEVADQLDV